MKKIGLVAMLALFAVAFVWAPAGAGMIYLRDMNTGASKTILDGSAEDANTTAGIVEWSGAVGTNWFVNVTLGVSYPVTGSVIEPIMHYSSVNASNGAGRLWTGFYDKFDYTGDLGFNVGGVSAGAVDFYGWSYSPEIWYYHKTFGTGAFSGSQSAFVDLDTTEYLSIGAYITHAGLGVTSFDASTTVPEPGTMMLLGSGLVGLAFYGRKRVR